MDPLRARSKEMLSTVYLTVLSMIQAIALQAIFERALALPISTAPDAVIAWLQVVACIEVIFHVFLIYSLAVIGLRWILSVVDTVLPFALGLLEFSMIEWIGSATLGLWLCAIAGICVVGTLSFVANVRRARAEPENAELVHLVSIPLVLAPIALGGAFAGIAGLTVAVRAGEGLRLALAAAVVAIGVIATLLLMLVWRRALVVEVARERSKAMLPAVYLTLTSMLQAVVLEATVARAHAIDVPFGFSTHALAVWLSIVAIVQAVFYVFAIYSLAVIALTWVVGIVDASVPFALGLMELCLVAWIGPESLDRWLLGAGALMVLGAFTIAHNLARAEREPENAAVMRVISRRLVLWPALAGGAIFMPAGMGVRMLELGDGASAGVMVAASSFLLAMTILLAIQWRRGVLAT